MLIFAYCLKGGMVEGTAEMFKFICLYEVMKSIFRGALRGFIFLNLLILFWPLPCTGTSGTTANANIKNAFKELCGCFAFSVLKYLLQRVKFCSPAEVTCGDCIKELVCWQQAQAAQIIADCRWYAVE